VIQRLPIGSLTNSVTTVRAIACHSRCVFLGAIAGTIGKMVTGQILWPAALALVVGTVPGAQFGGILSKKVNARYLRITIAVIIAATGLKMWHHVAMR
jgi:uncharacterized membrane protein YfcA